jgi:hypothetical protein
VITTPDVIASLSANLRPVRRLRPPLVRAACWLALGGMVVALLALSQGVRPDLFFKLRYAGFDFRLTGALLTAILSASAAFVLSLPDRSRFWCLLPLPSLALWLSTIEYQCLTDWIDIEPGSMQVGETARCFATLVLTGLPLSMALLVMLRHSAPLRPIAATITGSLAVAAITAVALSLFHRLDATVMILMWNLGIAAVFVSVGGAFGGRMFSWIAARISSGG